MVLTRNGSGGQTNAFDRALHRVRVTRLRCGWIDARCTLIDELNRRFASDDEATNPMVIRVSDERKVRLGRVARDCHILGVIKQVLADTTVLKPIAPAGAGDRSDDEGCSEVHLPYVAVKYQA